MGCHTWFYNKVKDASAEDLKTLRERLASKFEHYCDYPTFESYMEDDDNFKIYNALKLKGDTESEIFKINEQYVKRKKKRWKHLRQLRNEMPSKIRNGELSDEKFVKLYKKEDLFSTIYETPGFSDNFRTCDYETPSFRSFEKAKKYLTNHCDKFYIEGKETTFCGTNEEKLKQRLKIMLDVCKKFFEKYPKGWIEFG